MSNMALLHKPLLAEHIKSALQNSISGHQQLCIDPAVFAQVRPLMQMLERAFSSSAPGGDRSMSR